MKYKLYLLLFVICFISIPTYAKEKECIHEYSEWSEIKKPTCIENGEKVRFCIKCNTKEILKTKSLSHNFKYSKTIKNNTYFHVGIKGYKCTRCGIKHYKTIKKKALSQQMVAF